MILLPSSLFALFMLFIKRQGYSFFILLTLCIAINIGTNTILPNLQGKITDALIGDAQSTNFTRATYAFYTLICGWAAIEFFQRLKGVIMGFVFPAFEADIRVQFANYVIHQPYTFFNMQYGAAVGHRIDDLPRSMKFITDNVLTVFAPLLVSIFTSCIFFIQVNWIIGLAFFLWFVIYISCVVYFAIRATRYTSEQSLSRAKIQSRIVDILRNYLNIRLFDHLVHETQSLNEIQMEEMMKYRKTIFYIEKSKLILSILSCFGIVALFYLSISLVKVKLITAGDLIFIISSILSTMISLWWVADEMPYTINEIGICKRSLNLLITAYCSANENQVNEQNSQALPEIKIANSDIEFQNITFQYLPSKENNHNEKSCYLFENLSLKIEAGERIGLVGASGSGKTTFVKLLLGLYKTQQGQILIDGQNIALYNHSSLMKQISFIQQEPILFNRTIRENIAYGKLNASFDEIVEAAKKAHCHEFITSLPMQYETVISGIGSNISGGERQMIIIARAFLKDALILIIDEAMSSIDSITEHSVQRSLQSLMRNCTTIVIAHRLDLLPDLTRIVVLEKGKIVEDGKQEELMRIPNGYYARMRKIYESKQQSAI